MENFISSPIGLIHTLFAVLALITGTIVVLNKKGTRFHKRVGYVYVVSMLLLNLTAFGIYRLFNGFGMFHAAALLSLLALVGGMYPVLFRHKVKNWYLQHVKVMGWSVVGLYAAFAAEIGTRLFEEKYFFLTVGVSSFAVIAIGAFFIYRTKNREARKLKSQKNELN